MTGTISAVMRAIIDRVYPVGIIVDFAVEMDPNSAVGFGTQWQRIADGRALIASDASHPVGWAGGEEVHVLTTGEMPSHNHQIQQPGQTDFRPLCRKENGRNLGIPCRRIVQNR